MSIDLILLTISVITTLIYISLIYKTIKSNEKLNQRILFSNITKEERELRIRLQEYREKIENPKLNKTEREITQFNYETMLFNYYEYISICVYKKFINESDAKLYFKFILKSIKRIFNESLLFEKSLASKTEYPGIQWIFKKWKI